MSRHCSSCQRALPGQLFSPAQWAAAGGVGGGGNVGGAPVCLACERVARTAALRPAPAGDARGEYARRINAHSAEFSTDALMAPFAQGSFRWVAKGKYTAGPRAGEPCVGKWFKSGTVFSEEFFRHDIKAVDKALEIVTKFNAAGLVDMVVRVNIPEIWKFTDGSGPWAGSMILQEPYIKNYQKFNSNTGWNDNSTPWPQVMQALSHFSYHISGGQYVLCDLQGGIYSNSAVLTDPVVLSLGKRFGVTDLGPEGIVSFFSQHVCNAFCHPTWSRPAQPRIVFRPVAGTSMMSHAAPKLGYPAPVQAHNCY